MEMPNFFAPILNQDEIERVFNPKSTDDYLLKMRAEAIVDNTRLWRVIRMHYMKNERKKNGIFRHFSVI